MKKNFCGLRRKSSALIQGGGEVARGDKKLEQNSVWV